MGQQLNEEQKQAVEYLSGPLLVLAGPGTGKTQLLSAKVAYILENTDANPENILCLTFTDAGAENMYDRLQTMIGADAQKVHMRTYHAFGQDILGRYANYTDKPILRKFDKPIDGVIQNKIIIKILEDLPLTDILKGAKVGQIIETIGHAKGARLNPDDLRKIANQNIQDAQEILIEVGPYLENMPNGRKGFEVLLEEAYLPILSILEKYESDENIARRIPRVANVYADMLRMAMKEVQEDEKHSVKPLTSWREKTFGKKKEGYRPMDYIANKKLLSFADVMEKYNQALEEKDQYDFSDMIEMSIKYLSEDDDFRASMAEQYQYVLLDEFQDTNTSQFDLIKLLTDYENPTIMAVGDDDQAIYAFQGANASNLIEFREHYDAKMINLKKNYRSHKEILDISRNIADQIGDSFVKTYTDLDKILDAKKEIAPDSKAEIYRHEFNWQAQENDWIAQQIRGLIDDGVAPSEIAILSAQHKDLIAILPYLKKYNIDITYEKRENILEDEKIHSIIRLAEFFDRLSRGEQPREMLLEVFSYPFWGIPAYEVMQFFPDRYTQQSVLEMIEEASKKFPNLAEIKELFADLATKALSAPFEIWVNYLLGIQELNGKTSPIIGYYREHLPENELLEFYENLSTLRTKVREHRQNIGVETETPTLHDFVVTVNDYQEARAAILRISRFSDSEDAVQVMTAHKSKGLEFEYVFLSSFHDGAWGMGKGNNNKFSLPKNMLQIRHTGATDDEKLRLLFVAMTRAKRALIMTNAKTSDQGKKQNRLGYMDESSFEEEVPVSRFLQDHPEIQVHDEELGPDTKISILQNDWIGAYVEPMAEIEQIQRERVSNYKLSASDLTSFIDLTYAGPRAIYDKVVLRAPGEPATAKMCYGTIIHSICERVTKEGISDKEAVESLTGLVKALPLEPEEKQMLQEKAEQSLPVVLQEFGGILRSENSKAEVNFSPEHLMYGIVPLVGKIDHIDINEADKTIEIYDFKTGVYKKEGWNSHASLFKYRLQLGFYKLLLNLSPTYRKYKVTKGHILFVDLDLDGKVYDKEYDFDPKDEEQLKALIKAVYREIISLDYLGDKEHFVMADQSKTMTDIRKFVTELLEKHKNDVEM